MKMRRDFFLLFGLGLLVTCVDSQGPTSPMFSANEIRVEFNQNRRLGETVGTASCRPSFDVQYSTVSFNPDVRFLEIGSSGQLTLNISAVDLVPSFGRRVYMVILQCANTVTGLSDQTNLVVTVSDENEFTPTFEHPNRIELSFREDLDSTSRPVLVDVNATDSDVGSYGVITYSINAVTGTDRFSINPSSGEIMLVSPLDYETNTRYQFLVTAANVPIQPSGTVLNSDVTIVINVEDVDDERPVFSETSYMFSVDEINSEVDNPERPPPGFASVQCTDPDSPQSAITYAIFSDAGPFELDEERGSLSLSESGDLDYETQTSYSFNVMCFDNSLANNSNSARVDIAVISVNEFDPVLITGSRGTTRIFENLSVGTALRTTDPSRASRPYPVLYEYSDADAGPDGNITYTLGVDDEGDAEDVRFFNVDFISGELTIREPIDFDTIDIFTSSFDILTIAIQACDVFPPRSDCPRLSFSFLVFAVNEFSPQLAQDSYNVSVRESFLPGETILSASAVNCTDADRYVGGVRGVEFANPTADITNTFRIDSSTGEVITIRTLDYETATSYGFELRCRDFGGLDDRATVLVEVQPENDNRPVFDPGFYRFNVSRTTPATRYAVGRVLATDADVGFGGDLEYSIQSNGHFEISSDGELLLFSTVENNTESFISFDVRVTDGLQSDDAHVVIQLTEGNRNRPEFVRGQGSQTIPVSELTPVGGSIVQVLCEDNDNGTNGEIRYSIISGNTNSKFFIDPVSGEITVAGILTLPQNTPSEGFELAVVCSDLGVPTFSDDATIFIRVFQDDSRPPVINDTNIEAFVNEDVRLNTLVVTIEASDLDSERLNYRLEDESVPGAFIIEPSTGRVLTAVALDREVTPVYRMTVVVTEVRTSPGPERSDRANFTIFVRDANDNSPVCDTTMLVATIPETLDIGDSILQLNCSDIDLAPNANLTYFLSNGFGVLDISSSGEILLGNHLNATDLNTLVVEFRVNDQGSPLSLESTYQVTIFIMSINRNIPDFVNLPLTLNVSEAQPTQQEFFSVVARDPDRGVFGQLTYRIVNREENPPFTIIPNTGAIILTSKLNFFEQNLYTLNVSVEDSDHVVSELLTILVLDANEFTPECDSTIITTTLRENLPPVELEESLSCSDGDQGTNGDLTYSILSGNTDTAFEVRNDGRIFTLLPLDFESLQNYELVVQVSDGGNPPLSVNVSVRVGIQPVNEFTPVFTSELYEASIFENVDAGESVLEVLATDMDRSSHPHGQVSYSLVGLGDPVFSISDSGLLQVAGNLDREVQHSYIFIVQANDQGLPSLVSTAQINVTILDLDDNSPQFTQDLYNAFLNRSAENQTFVTIVTCTDEDIDDNAVFSYSLDQSSVDSQFFSVNEMGHISVGVDVPVSGLYTFMVLCSGPPPQNRSDTAVVTVQVVVDSSITFLPSSIYQSSLLESITPVHDILNVRAVSSTGATLTYTLPSEATNFAVNRVSGNVQLIASLDYEETQLYALRVQASDNGDPPNVAEALVEVSVINVNDEAPSISTPVSAISISEGPTTIRTVIAEYNCSDDDLGTFGEVRFSIVSGNPDGAFAISDSGALQLVRDLDYETRQSYGLEVVCRDGGDPPRTDSITVPVNVLPINDNDPDFGVDLIPISVNEDVSLSSLIGLPITAADLDLPPHNSLQYTIISGNTVPPTFSLSSTSGQLTLVQTLDYESQTTYTLVVLADDSGGEVAPEYEVLNDTVTVEISVVDVNDNSPVFTESVYTGRIDEGREPGAEVSLDVPVSCSDADSGENSRITYSISGDVFSIQSNGRVTVQSGLDFESSQRHTLTVTCRDNGEPSRSAEASLSIIVSDVNEFGPQFLNASYRFSIPENAAIGGTVGTVEAEDLDAGEFGSIMYSVSNTSTPFSLDPASGDITLSDSLDYETQSREYVLAVSASDTAGNSDQVTVVVTVLNVDDNNPSFTETRYFTSIRENSQTGVSAGQVSCSDADDLADNIPVMYSLSSSVVDLPFTIDRISGVLTVTGSLDLETTPRYITQVACHDSAGKNTTATLTININPFNDFPPVFVGAPFSTSLLENSLVGTTVVRVSATDDDNVEYNVPSFSIVGGNIGDRFSIDRSSGIVRVNQPIDREELDEYTLMLQVENMIAPGDTSGSPPLSSTTTLNISIVDQNDNDPMITPSAPTAVFVPEADGPSAFVIDFDCDDPDFGPNGTISFSIPDTGNFQIFENGSLYTTVILRTNVVVDVTCSDGGTPPRMTSVSIPVNAVSMNDHPPQFATRFQLLPIPEDFSVGVDWQCLTATDEDGPDNPDGVLEYSLSLVSTNPTGDVSRFGIREDTGCIFVTIGLNFDITRAYTYTITATDMGDEPLSGSTRLIVFITDTIQDPPRFSVSSYSQNIFETAESGTLVVQVSCTDTDDNDTVIYNITRGNELDLFTIDITSGVIEIAQDRMLDYETSTLHTLRVQCVDTFGLSDTGEVFVNVVPINEYTPTFVSVPLEIAEDTLPGSPVTQLRWFDQDDGPDGETEFQLVGGNINDAFGVDPDGRIFVRGMIDREMIEEYSLEITITDQSEDESVRRSSSNIVNITITDINDNVPSFGADPYVLGPLEGNENPGHFVGSVLCSDDDIGSNADVTYQLVDQGSLMQFFNVSTFTGNVVVANDLSEREFDNITFFVQCTDSGVPPRSSMTRVVVSVIEINRHAPEFTNASYYIEVPEDTRIIEDIFLTVHADDRDTGINSIVHYSLQDDLDNRFFIDDDTGSLSLLRPLDFESETNYTLVVEAIDGTEDSPMRLSSTAQVMVVITGINEFIPDCLDPIYVVIINKTTEGEIIDFGCLDDDNGEDGVLTYNITSGSTALFDVSDDGELVIPSPIAPDTDNEQFLLGITVSDMGDPSRSTDIEAIIIYSFDNLDSPKFEEDSYLFNVSELIQVGQIVTSLVAQDTDPSLQGQIIYSLMGTNNFRIDSNTGDLFVASPLDWETSPLLTFTVIAQDRDPFAPLRGTVQVTINVLNENDNLPQCDQTFYTAQVLSSAMVGDTVVLLNCSDADNNGLSYSFVTSMRRQASSFAIDSNTGRIFVAGPLSPSTTSLLTVRVSGEDGEMIDITVSIQILFSNQEPPIFSESVYSLTVAEDTILLSTIGMVLASDADSRVEDVTYVIVNADQNSEFYINPENGNILLTAPLDYESLQHYSFVVMVQDSGSHDGSNRLNDTATVFVNVTNTNDNLPMLSSGGIYGSTVSETTAVNTAILNLTCSDNDSPPFSGPSITSTGFDGLPFDLTVGMSSAQASIFVSQNLSGPSAYFVNITCSDQGALSSEGQVFIFVPEPLAPMYSQTVYEWFISESADVGSEYSDIDATSNDGSDITYSFVEGNENDIFYINPATGEVSLVTSLDYETQRRHGLIVRAVDGANRQSSVLLLVQVLDENDEVPLTPPSALLSVAQNAPVGHPVGVLECTDDDTTPTSGSFNFTFIPPSDIFSVDNHGVVRVERLLDDSPVYVLPVTCSDLTEPDSLSTGVVTIEVDFVNLHPPQFEFPRYDFSVSEDRQPLDFVGAVSATDNDVGSFGEVSYTVSDGNPNKFFIQASTGRIGILTSLDRETQGSYLLTVVATDGGIASPESARMTGTTMVSITVEDVNDNHPAPDQLLYVQSIITNHTLLSPVLTVQCSDPDLGDSGVVDYSLSPTQDDFLIQTNGTILLAREQSAQAVYNFNAVCRDRGLPMLSSSALVTVTVDFMSVGPPVFDQSEYNVTIPESELVNSIILTVSATPNDPSENVVYRITSGNEASRFHVNSITGDVIVINELDASAQQLYVLVVEASTTGRRSFTTSTSVRITVTDINNNEPVFTSSFYTASINESMSLLSPVIQVVCTDEDVDAEISYTITEGQNGPVFNITEDGLITIVGEVDYETETQYTLVVTCSDGGDNPRTTATSVRIDVQPLNEFIPLFLRSEYSFPATENSFGTQIGMVQATDDDTGSHGDITYLLQDPGNFSVVFVEPLSGNVLIANNLDYESQTSWNLTVIAQDGGGAQSHARLHIQVVNVNDVSPVLSPLAVTATVSADSPAGFPIQSFMCTDADGSGTSLSITNGNNMGYFMLSPMNILLWSGTAGELTTNAVVSLTLRCEDSELSDQFDMSHIAVSIVVSIVEQPVFSQEVYSRTVLENTPNGTVVMTVSATGPNEAIMYSFFNLPTTVPFAVDPSSGNVTVVSSLDRESVALYSFVVRAVDTMTQAVGLSIVEITVEDTNDNRPVIRPATQTVTLGEDLALSTPIAFYTCSDSDTGMNAVTSFQITEGDANSTFVIDSSGLITLGQPLDFETTTSYSVEVVCRDNGVPSLTSTAAYLMVAVTGVNEFPPTFTNTTYIFVVSEQLPAGEVVGEVNATDLDEGSDGDLDYSILAGDGTTYFTVNSQGVIRTGIQPLNASENPVVEFTVQARDSGGLSDNAVVAVIVEDINEPPQFSETGSYFIVTTTDTPVQIQLLNVTCFDVDLSDNALLTLELTSLPVGLERGFEFETVIAQGVVVGTLLTNSTLEAGSYELTLRCSDSGSPRLSTNATITLRVDVINTPPVIVHATATVSIPETTPVGTLVGSVNASDTESGVRYDITGGNGLGTFDIDSMTGELRIFLPLDFETTPSYQLTVTAFDLSVFDQLSASVEISIVISNANDQPPALQPLGTQQVTLSENIAMGHVVHSYTCSDPDGQSVSLSLSPSQPASPFALLPNGNVVLQDSLDYDNQSTYNLVVTCTDTEVRLGEGTVLTSTANLIIAILPVNNHSPEFVSPLLFEVSEATVGGTIIAQVEATDRDGRGVVTYSSTSHPELFVIDTRSGEIILIGELDYEGTQSYVLTVTASDNDNIQGVVMPRSSTVMITISVLDFNDNAPTCDSNFITTQLNTSTYMYISLTQLSCSDVDEGSNAILMYSFVESSLPQITGGSFVLNQTTGELGFTGTLSFSTIYVIEVLVSDSSNTSRLTTVVTVTVQVITTDMTRPQFIPSMFMLNISENTESSTVIFNGTILQEALVNPGDLDVSYSIRPDAKHSGAFIINIVSGDITLSNKEVIDYDSSTQNYTIFVDTLVGTNTATAIVEVFLTDYNDNAPQFTNTSIRGSVLENSPSLTSVLQVSASDIDSDENAEIRYSIMNSGDFTVDPLTGDITTLRVFDRERNDIYTVIVLATDLGEPAMTGSAVVTVDVLDVNDNPPMFRDGVFRIDIDNLHEPGAPLIMFEVMDPDLVGDLAFQIITNSTEVRALFTVDSPDGVLRQRSVPIPDDHLSEYRFTVQVNDEIQIDTAMVIIRVRSATRTTTIFEENVSNQRYNVTEFLILENFNITESASYEIGDGDPLNDFLIGSNGILQTRGVLDREAISQYVLQINVSDSVSLVDVTLYITVIVSDQNDNSPTFELDLYLFNVSEGSYLDSVSLGFINATDLDQPGTSAAQLEYRIIGAAAGRSDFFNIDQVSGELSISEGSILDREKDAYHTLAIGARDFGEPNALTTSTIVNITLIDINDNDPEFIPLDVVEYYILVSFMEVTPPHTVLNKITAFLPEGVTDERTFIQFRDPDEGDEVISRLEAADGSTSNYYLNKDVPNQVTLSRTVPITFKDNGTVLRLVLTDEPNDPNPIIRNITIFVANQSVVVTQPPKPLDPGESFFETEIGIAVIVVICVVIVALVCFIISLFLYCYLKIKREKDPLRNADRINTVYQQLRTETDRKRKKFGNAWEYGEIDQIYELSPHDPAINQMYPPPDFGEGEFDESSLADDINPLTPLTGTSALPSLDFDDTQSTKSDQAYTMGPVLRAMLDEWDMGEELLVKRKKKHRSKQSLNRES